MTILSFSSEFDSKSVTDWNAYRENFFPVARKWSYFDHAAVSPLPSISQQAIERWLQQATEEGDVAWPNWSNRLKEIRFQAARLVNAQPAEIAFIPSTSFGISLVAEGLEWQPGDNVVLPDGEFPSNLYPWMNLESRGVELRVVPTDSSGEINLQRIDDACDQNTRLVSSSWVGYASGYRICPKSLAEIAHRHNALFFLDAIQGLGVFPLDVEESNIDFFAADGHKWLMGPEGAGIFYCRKSLLNRLRPSVVGWNSVATAHEFSKVDFTLKDDASRFEAGTQNTVGIIGMGASLDLISATGVTASRSPIAERILSITQLLNESLSDQGWECHSQFADSHLSGIITFSKPGVDPVGARSQLMDSGVVCSVRNGLLRFSPHAYINESDIERTVIALSRF